MPITVRCISCGKASLAKDELAGKKVKCRCGAMLDVPAAKQQKICHGCGADITNAKRGKDQQGNYYCEVCFKSRVEAAKVATSATEEIVYYPCYTCDLLCTADEVYDAGGGQTVCKKCWAAGKRPAGTGVPGAGSADAAGEEDMFCEACGNTFPPTQLSMSAEGAVLCKSCLKSAQKV